ncbi:MAG TPA: helix-turn-helix transcriptional regulator [Thermoanaerobaculia bacterium]
MSFKDLIQDAKSRDDYWIEDAILQFTMRLHEQMQKQGISKTELASRIGASQPYITRILKGRDNLTIATMVKLARAVGLKVQISLEETDPRAEEKAILPTYRGSGLQPGVDLDNSRSLLDRMESSGMTDK